MTIDTLIVLGMCAAFLLLIALLVGTTKDIATLREDHTALRYAFEQFARQRLSGPRRRAVPLPTDGTRRHG